MASPLRKTIVKPVALPAAARKKLDAAIRTLDDDPSPATAEALLATAAKEPFDTDGVRINAEWQALDALVKRGDLSAARTVWTKLATSWSAQPHVGGMGWYVLARTLGTLGDKLPSKARARFRMAWAWGVLTQVFEYKHGTSTTARSNDGPALWKQGCIEITLQQFERARASVDALHRVRGYEYSAKCLDIMLRREEGDTQGSRDSLRELVALAKKKKSYAQWDVIAALAVILGEDKTLAREILAGWSKDKAPASAIFEG
ncbi:MAG: hypothetical protein ACKV2T_07320 [Kofleriaceae bacterium]